VVNKKSLGLKLALNSGLYALGNRFSFFRVNENKNLGFPLFDGRKMGTGCSPTRAISLLFINPTPLPLQESANPTANIGDIPKRVVFPLLGYFDNRGGLSFNQAVEQWKKLLRELPSDDPMPAAYYHQHVFPTVAERVRECLLSKAADRR